MNSNLPQNADEALRLIADRTKGIGCFCFLWLSKRERLAIRAVLIPGFKNLLTPKERRLLEE